MNRGLIKMKVHDKIGKDSKFYFRRIFLIITNDNFPLLRTQISNLQNGKTIF